MTNLEYLRLAQQSDNGFYHDNEWRQAKALEIIAEELIKLNETFDNGLNITGDINTTGEMDFKGKFEYEE